jgi:hypothetical protein
MSRRNREDKTPPISLFAFQDVISTLSGIFIFIVLIMAVDLSMLKPVGADGDSINDKAVIDQLRTSVQALKQRIVALKSAMTTLSSQDSVNIAEKCTQTENENELLLRRHQQLVDANVLLEKRLSNVKHKQRETEVMINPLKHEIQRLQAALAKAAKEKQLFFIPEPGITKTPLIVECSKDKIRAGFIARDAEPVVFEFSNHGYEAFEKYIGHLSITSEYLVFMIKPSGSIHRSRLYSIAKSAGFDLGFDALEESKAINFGKATQ